MWHQCPTGWDKDLLSEALVPAQGQPSFLQGPAGWPGPDRGDCSGGLHRPAVWIRGAVCLLAGVERARTANVQVCCWGPGQSGELDQSPAVSQSQLPGPARDGHWEEVQRWETERLSASLAERELSLFWRAAVWSVESVFTDTMYIVAHTLWTQSHSYELNYVADVENLSKSGWFYSYSSFWRCRL